jgi:predicted nucleotidyltransferase component of viral defense system
MSALFVIEKDYVLGWMLAGIYAHDELADNWIFKGGTCFGQAALDQLRLGSEHQMKVRIVLTDGRPQW